MHGLWDWFVNAGWLLCLLCLGALILVYCVIRFISHAIKYIFSREYRQQCREDADAKYASKVAFQRELEARFARLGPPPPRQPQEVDEYLAIDKNGMVDPAGPTTSAGTARERAGEDGRVEWRKSYR